MRRSNNRILVSHAGTVPRPSRLQELYEAGPEKREAFLEQLPSGVKEVVRRQAETGIDVVNDGELSNRNFPHYAQERLGLPYVSKSAELLGPHQNDIPLEHIVDIILSVKAQVYSVEAANPRHDHEWRMWQNVELPEAKSLMPGVIGHATDIIEHPRLVADRLVRYAGIVGKENVIAGTDCGVGSRVFNAEIAWGKFAGMAEGARMASRELWGE